MSQGVWRVPRAYRLGHDRTLARGRHPRPAPLAKILLAALLATEPEIQPRARRVFLLCPLLQGRLSSSCPDHSLALQVVPLWACVHSCGYTVGALGRAKGSCQFPSPSPDLWCGA